MGWAIYCMNLNCESEKDPAAMVIHGYNLRF
jgi:hypothetical protein